MRTAGSGVAIGIMALLSLVSMMFRASVAISLAAALLSACSDKPKTTRSSDAGADAAPGSTPFLAVHSCDWRAAAGTCTDFASKADLELHKKMCESFKGSFAEAPCPTDKLVGSCEVEKDERKRYYEGTAPLSFTAQIARENCESPHLKGKFTDP